MEYKFDKLDNYKDFASGSVLYNTKNVTNFPVRLANEIFNRCLAYSDKKEDINLYDPCCGGAYLLTAISFLNNQVISHVLGSDIDEDAILFANKNVGLLTDSGLKKREIEIKNLIRLYDKESHKNSLESIHNLKRLMVKDIKLNLFKSDVFRDQNGLDLTADIIISDVPYGDMKHWHSTYSDSLNAFLAALKAWCSVNSIVAIVHTKGQKITKNEGFLRLEKFKVGKRIIEIYKRLDDY